jgi:hypothetical protein
MWLTHVNAENTANRNWSLAAVLRSSWPWAHRDPPPLRWRGRPLARIIINHGIGSRRRLGEVGFSPHPS